MPELGLNVLSTTITQTSVKTHYAATAIPALLAATVYGVARFGERAGYVVALAALCGAIALGPIGRVGHRCGAARGSGPTRARARPRRAPVSATNALGAHLSARRRIFSFPVLREAEWVVVDTTAADLPRQPPPERRAAALAALRRDPDWRLVFAEDGVLVFRRR